MKLLAEINPEAVSETEVSGYKVREAARAVVVDALGLIALLHVSNDNYYKLPGGGFEQGEDTIAALDRECMEEIGCGVEVLAEIGMIVEYRKIFSLKQISYCYVAKVRGEKGVPHFDGGEIEKGFKELWVPYDHALKLLENSRATSFEGSAYIVPRDTLLLKLAKNYLDDVK